MTTPGQGTPIPDPEVATAIAATRREAEAAFASGLFCAESVIQSLAQARGLDPAPLCKAATVFCSGVARTSATCGALNGALMGVGLALGRSGPGESVEPAYAAARRLIREFEDAFGSGNCQALLSGCDLNTPEGQARFKAERLGVRCQRYTGAAAEMAARILAEHDR